MDGIRFVKQVWEEWQVVPFDRILSLTHILHHINSYYTLNTLACKNNLCIADHWTSLPLSKALFLIVLRTTRICSHGVLGLTSQVIAVCQKTALVKWASIQRLRFLMFSCFLVFWKTEQLWGITLFQTAPSSCKIGNERDPCQCAHCPFLPLSKL